MKASRRIRLRRAPQVLGLALCAFSGASRAVAQGGVAWDTLADTWIATDALGRTTPTNAQVGGPRVGKTVAMFYFLWLGQHGTQGPFDISKILRQDPDALRKPDSPLWGPVGTFHHWGEPALGYYVSTDEWVIRRHAQMLSDAGVDAIIFDTTNNFRYTDCYRAICRVFTKIRQEGGRTPQIAFLAPFGDAGPIVFPLFEEFYGRGDYSDLWFRWEGKPLIMADAATLHPSSLNGQGNDPSRLQAGHTQGQAFTAKSQFLVVGALAPTWSTKDAGATLSLYAGGRGGRLLKRQRFENIVDNSALLLQFEEPLPPGDYYLEQSEPSGAVGWWSHTGDTLPGAQALRDGEMLGTDRSLILSQQPASQVLDFFTFRKPVASYFDGPSGPNQWPWLEVFPQHIFASDDNAREMMAVGVAQNVVEGKLGAMSNAGAQGRSFARGQQPPPAQQDWSGRNFQEQWSRALQADPSAVFVTGWNEWVAQRYGSDAGFAGAGPVTFVDQFSPERSRDIEPVRGGHGDSYYYQLVSNIRRFKGARPLPLASRAKSIRLDGPWSQWSDVGPEYRDDRFDTAHRDERGWGDAGRLTNTTGRNNFVRLRVARDARNVYFYAQTREPITARGAGDAAHTDWMQLLLDTRGDGRGAFAGFGLAINRRATRPGFASIEAATRSEGALKWRQVGEASVRVSGDEMMISVPRATLGLSGGEMTLDFKWTDNVGAEEVLNLYSNGDTAPNGRFRYRYSTARRS